MESTLGGMALLGIGMVSLGASALVAATLMVVRDRRAAKSVPPGSGVVVDLLDTDPVEPASAELDALEVRILDLTRRVERLAARERVAGPPRA